MTSSDPMISLTGGPIGTCSSLISRCPVMCWAFHIHCLPTMKTSIAPLGTRYRSKKTLAPQPNIPIAMTNGMTVQSSSSASEP